MNIRELRVTDLKKLKEIHEKYYEEEFSFPEFFNSHCLCAFVVESDDNEIVSAGGVRTIAESIVMTDKQFSVRTRKEALVQVLQASQFVTQRFGYDLLHAFIQDSDWEQHLKKVGFIEPKGNCLII